MIGIDSYMKGLTRMFETQDERNQFYWSNDWRKMRLYILDHDNFECQVCKREGRVTTQADSRLFVDHIKELATHPELRLEPSNLEVKCFDCHEQKHGRMFVGSNGHKNKWADDEWW